MIEKYGVTIDRLRELFSYDPETGLLKRLKTTSSHTWAGTYVNKNAHTIGADGAKFQVPHVCWALHYGVWPTLLVEHADRDHCNNRIKNLREATHAQNGMNLTQPNKTGLPFGVTITAGRKKKPYCAQIRIDGKKTNLGRFATPEEAAEAYRVAKIKHHGEFAPDLVVNSNPLVVRGDV